MLFQTILAVLKNRDFYTKNWYYPLIAILLGLLLSGVKVGLFLALLVIVIRATIIAWNEVTRF